MKKIYEFDSFLIDVNNRTLFNAGEPVPLKPKVFDTLLLLVEGKGNLVGKEHLMQGVWGDTIVEENNLTQNISMLRRALGASPGGDSYIETHPKRGYRFHAPVREYWDEDDALVVEKYTSSHIVIEQKSAQPLTQLVTPEPPPQKTDTALSEMAATTAAARFRWWQSGRMLAATAIIAVVVLVAGVAIGRFFPPPEAEPHQEWRFALEPNVLLDFKVSGTGLAISSGVINPAGNLIAYSRFDGKKDDVWIISTEGGLPQAVTRDEFRNLSPVWAVDGGEIAYVSVRGDKATIWRIPLLGGMPKLVYRFEEKQGPSPATLPTLIKWVDGKIYYSCRGNLYALEIETSQILALTNFEPSKSNAHGFAVSADQQWACYVAQVDGQFDIWKIALPAGDPIRVTNTPAIERHPVWHPKKNRILYKTHYENRNYLCSVDVASGKATEVSSGEDDGFITDISPDGARLLYRSRADHMDLWKAEVESGRDEPFTEDRGLEFYPFISPDAKSVAFHQIKGKYPNWEPNRAILQVKDLASRAPLLEIAADASQPQWSPDGTRLAFVREEKALGNLHLLDPQTGAVTALTSAGIFAGGGTVFPFTKIYVQDYAWSPDSSHIAYRSRKDLLSNLHIISRDGSGDTAITANLDSNLRHLSPMWSPDSTKISYLVEPLYPAANRQAEQTLWVYESQASNIWLKTIFPVRPLGWLSADELLIATVPSPDDLAKPSEVTLLVVTAAGSREVGKLQNTYLSNLHLSASRKSLAYVSTGDGYENIYILSIGSTAAKQVTKNQDAKVFFSSLAWSPDDKVIIYGRQGREYLLTMMNNLK